MLCLPLLLSAARTLDKKRLCLKDWSLFFLLLSTLQSWQPHRFITSRGAEQHIAHHCQPLPRSLSVWTPSRGGAWLLSRTCWLLIRRRTGHRGSRLNLTAGITYFCFVLWAHVYNVSTWILPLMGPAGPTTSAVFVGWPHRHYILSCVQ